MFPKSYFEPGEEPSGAIPVVLAKTLAQRMGKDLIVIIALNRDTLQMEYTEFAIPGRADMVDAIIRGAESALKAFADTRAKDN